MNDWICIYITTPYFCAGVLTDEAGAVVSAPPIVRYMQSWTAAQVILYCKKKGWEVQVIDDDIPF